MRPAMRLRGAAYDLILLDLMLPDGRGIAFPARRLRARGDVTPGDHPDRARSGLGPDRGAERRAPTTIWSSPSTSPNCPPGSARSRGATAGNPNPIITHGPLEIDLAARSIRRDGKPVQLTAREWALFEAFLSRPGQLLSKAQLEEKLYAFDAEVESNTIEVHVSRLRKKLGPAVIETERGLGYRLGTRMRVPRSLQARLGAVARACC